MTVLNQGHNTLRNLLQDQSSFLFWTVFMIRGIASWTGNRIKSFNPVSTADIALRWLSPITLCSNFRWHCINFKSWELRVYWHDTVSWVTIAAATLIEFTKEGCCKILVRHYLMSDYSNRDRIEITRANPRQSQCFWSRW